MALKKKKAVDTEEVPEVKTLDDTPKEDVVEVDTSPSYMNPDEADALAENNASIDKLTQATALVSRKFNLDDSYYVTSFKDKTSTISLTLESCDFEVSVTIKKPSDHGLY